MLQRSLAACGVIYSLFVTFCCKKLHVTLGIAAFMTVFRGPVLVAPAVPGWLQSRSEGEMCRSLQRRHRQHGDWKLCCLIDILAKLRIHQRGLPVSHPHCPRELECSADEAALLAQVTHGRREDVQDGAGILAGSKSVLKRQREEAAAEATDRRARHLRQEMRKRGHAKVPRRGEDPPQDAAEKLLLRTARKVLPVLVRDRTSFEGMHAWRCSCASAHALVFRNFHNAGFFTVLRSAVI